MKNYYTQLSELRIAEARLETLKEKKGMLEARATKTTSQIKEVTVYTNATNDNMSDYVIKCEEINKQIEEVEAEVRILKKGLQRMDEIIKNISRLYYIENKNPTQISFIIPCDRRTVYRYLDKIKQKM